MMEAVNEALAKMAETGEFSVPHKTPVDAYKDFIKHITRTYMKSDVLKSMSDAGAFISRATGMLDDKGTNEKEDSLPVSGLEDARVIMQVFNFYQKSQLETAPDVIDANFVEQG
jgi:hypothetical protein